MNERADEAILALTARQALTEIAKGRLDAARYVRATVDRMEAREPSLKAWAFIGRDVALEQAAKLDGAHRRGPLHGIPVGLKDVIDTADMPTAHNSPFSEGFRPAADAPCVEVLRRAGAVIVGKTETTEFASIGRFPRTRNPHDLDRTSGGSSAGSAAAVADFQIPLALGTQTGGSTMRPASFCGVHAFKPTWGRVSREGVKLFSASFDTVSWFARSVDDLDLLAEVFAIGAAVPSPASVSAVRIAMCRTPRWDAAEPPMRNAFEQARRSMVEAGAQVVDLELPAHFADLNLAHDAITEREGEAAFLNLYVRDKANLHDNLRRMVENRNEVSDQTLRQAYDLAARCRQEFDAIASDFDAVLAPSAAGEAPKGQAPGNHVLNQIWSILQTPCVNLPRWRSEAGMPLGMTLTTRRFDDRRLLAVADCVDRALVPGA